MLGEINKEVKVNKSFHRFAEYEYLQQGNW